jgi:hypothetical protein
LRNVQIGSMLLNGQIVMYLILGIVGWIVLHYRLRQLKDKDLYAAYATNAFWIGLLIWKGSYILFHPAEVMHQPMSLLYFDGGERGMLAGGLVAATYIGYKSWKQRLSLNIWIDLGVWYFCGGVLSYHVLLLAVGEQPSWFHALSAALAVLFLFMLGRLQQGTASGRKLDYAVWFLIGNVLLIFMVSDRPVWVLSFTKQQVIFILAAMLLTTASWVNQKQQKGNPHE